MCIKMSLQLTSIFFLERILRTDSISSLLVALISFLFENMNSKKKKDNVYKNIFYITIHIEKNLKSYQKCSLEFLITSPEKFLWSISQKV